MSALGSRFDRLRLVVVLTALVVLTSAIGTTLALTRPPLSSAETARAAERVGPGGERDAAAVSAAVASARLALTYRHDELGPGLRAATATMTGEFAHAFADSFRRDFVPAIRRTHATSDATVRAAGLVRAHGDQAVVLVLVDQVRRDDRSPSGAATSWRLALDLSWTGSDGSSDSGGEWRVDDVRPL